MNVVYDSLNCGHHKGHIGNGSKRGKGLGVVVV